MVVYKDPFEEQWCFRPPSSSCVCRQFLSFPHSFLDSL